MRKKSKKSQKENLVKKGGFIALGVVAILAACGIYWKQTDPKTQLIRIYGAKDVAEVETAYITTVATEKLCERSWTKLAETSGNKNETLKTIVMKYYDLQAELSGREMMAKPRELINDYVVKLGPKAIEKTKTLIESQKKTDETLEETYDKFCYGMFWESMNKVDELRATYTTIPEVQEIVQKELDKAVATYQAKGATGIIMETKTGHIVSLVSVGHMDPMRYVYEMGSVFKIFNTALAYENGLENKEYKIDEPLMIYDKHGKKVLPAPIDDVASFKRNIQKQGITTMTASDIMLNSCNVGSARIALDLPENAQKEFFHRLHLDEKLDLGFYKTEKGLMHRKWGPVERATAAFGHGIAVTPVNFLAAANAVVNDGVFVYPTMSKAKTKQGERVLSSDISSKLRNVMFQVVESTSGRKAKIKGIEIGGKTGTAEKRYNGKSDGTKVVTTFVTVFPVSDPQYTILTMLDEPQATKDSAGWKTSAWNVVPTTGKILEQVVPMLIKNK